MYHVLTAASEVAGTCLALMAAGWLAAFVFRCSTIGSLALAWARSTEATRSVIASVDV